MNIFKMHEPINVKKRRMEESEIRVDNDNARIRLYRRLV